MKNKVDSAEEQDKKLRQLQETCMHPMIITYNDPCTKTGEWIDFFIKRCCVCSVILSRRTWCNNCYKEISDDEIKTIELGFELCPDCFKDKDAFLKCLFDSSNLEK